jgi:hypothetical protein
MTEHPITPPPELVKKWVNQSPHINPEGYIATQAAQWGADQELEACCEWLEDTDCEDPQEVANHLRAARRPKPPSLKEQALNCLADIEHGATPCPSDFDTIRRALNQLPDD